MRLEICFFNKQNIKIVSLLIYISLFSVVYQNSGFRNVETLDEIVFFCDSCMFTKCKKKKKHLFNLYYA